MEELLAREQWRACNGPKDKAQAALYRFEHDGVVVYDSRARLAEHGGQEFRLHSRKVHAQVVKDLEGANEFGNF